MYRCINYITRNSYCFIAPSMLHDYSNYDYRSLNYSNAITFKFDDSDYDIANYDYLNIEIPTANIR